MEKLLKILVISVFVKVVENIHHPKFIRAFVEHEKTKSRQAQSGLNKVPCNSTMDDERDTLMNEANCGTPKEVLYELHVPSAAHEEIYPAAVWVKRCVGLCDDHGTDTKCLPKEKIKHQIPIKIVNTKTSKESCSQYSIEEHVSCSCQRCVLDIEKCKADGKLFNPRTCSCRCPNYQDRRDCFAQKQSMRWNRPKCMCEARDGVQ